MKDTPLFGVGDTPSIKVIWSHQQRCPDHFHVWFDVELAGVVYPEGSDVMVDDDGCDAYVSNDLKHLLKDDHRVEHAVSLMAANKALEIFKEVNQ